MSGIHRHTDFVIEPKKDNTQIDHTAYEVGNQLRISLECDVRKPKNATIHPSTRTG